MLWEIFEEYFVKFDMMLKFIECLVVVFVVGVNGVGKMMMIGKFMKFFCGY